LGSGSLFLTVFLLGLTVAACSSPKVVAVIVLLTMPGGRRRGISFVFGWLLAIAAIGAFCLLLLHPQDFSSHKTTPSRAASVAEIVVGAIAVVGTARVLRRRGPRERTGETPRLIKRLEGTKWWLALPVGALLLNYSLTTAAAAETMKANVPPAEVVLALGVFASTSILAIVAPVIAVVVAPDWAEEALPRWRQWLLGNARTIGFVALLAAGALLVVKGTHDLVV
jgi:hypothetical protein